MRLKATKTNLYKLVSEYVCNLPKKKDCVFVVSSNPRSYYLDWDYGSANLSACAGQPLLFIKDGTGDEPKYYYHWLRLIPELEELDMIDYLHMPLQKYSVTA